VRAIAITLALLAGAAHAQPRPLAPDEISKLVSPQPPEVVLLTFGVGERIFEKWGHAALCLDRRVCFNFGVTDFDEGPGMIWPFVRGAQRFWVDPEHWADTLGYYMDEDRDIYEQVLPLTPAQARAVERELVGTLDEKHRYYHYDQFTNNCTTRLRDAIDRGLGGWLYTTSQARYPLTFRELGLRGLADVPALAALTDFVIGRVIDEQPTRWDAMFHPGVLREQIAALLGAQPRLMYRRHGPAFPTEGSRWRLPMLAIALVFTLPLLLARRWRKLERPAVAWAALFLTLWGGIVWTLVLASPIPALRWNENVLVFVPFDVVLPVLGAARRRAYATVRIAGLLLVSALCGIGVLHQPLWIPVLSALLPFALMAMIRPKFAPPRE